MRESEREKQKKPVSDASDSDFQQNRVGGGRGSDFRDLYKGRTF